MTKTILILCGGKSEEHEISLISAKCILDALDRTKFTPVVVGISRKGVWYFEKEKDFYVGEVRADKIRLNETAPRAFLKPFPNANGRGVLQADGREVEFDIVFPILHGPFGEDGTMQGLWDIVGVPYVGSNCGSSWICMDKALTKALCEQHKIPNSKSVLVNDVADLTRLKSEIAALGFPLFVKPCRLGSSVGITKVKAANELEAAVQMALKHDHKVLIEQGIKGREIEAAVLGLSRSAKCALPGEVIPSPQIGWYSYEAKYLLKDGADVVIPAKLEPAMVKAVQEFALRTFRALECDGMARVDMFIEEGTGRILLNEVNTIPGFTPISMYPKMWQASGLGYSDLITQLLELAQARK